MRNPAPTVFEEETPLRIERLGPWLTAKLAEFDAVVFDVDGVLMRERKPLPGSLELIEQLRRAAVPFNLLTNDGCHSPEEKTAYLRRCGFDFGPEDIVSSSHGLMELVPKHRWTGRRFFVMGYLGEPCYARRAGLVPVRDLNRLASCQGVIVGEMDYDWQATITAVFNRLRSRSETPLVVPNPDEFFPGREGDLEVASGAVARFIQTLARSAGLNVEPIYLGKPYAPIFEMNHRQLERRCGRAIDRRRVLFAGDSLEGDVRGGRDYGYRTVLVMTGITDRHMLRGSSVQPEIVAQAL
ncbi:MAG: HAD-IIA family hydrolase [Kiritimatiellaeota bacterium]|nr:HAD-IIA family hydrolase [Kiritimatiellota bacterium]